MRRHYLLAPLLLLSASFTLSRFTKALRVIGGNVTVLRGETATLPCYLDATSESLSQISWQRRTKGRPQNDNFFTILPKESNYVNGDDGPRFKFIGDFTARNGSLQLSNVTLLDEGIYSCIFTLFPSGYHKAEIQLNILVPPEIIVKDNFPLLGDKEVPLVSCTAARSRPPAEVKWITGTMGNKVKAIINTTQHAEGTTTTVSSLFGVPTKEIYQHLVSCVVTSPVLTEAKTLPFKLQVYFSPTEVNIIEVSQNTFECLTEANPSADFAWNRPGQSWPHSAVGVDGPRLQLLSLNTDLNGLYQCHASNLYGRASAQLYVHLHSGSCTACWVLFSLVFILLVAIGLAAAWWVFLRRKGDHSTNMGTQEVRQRDLAQRPEEEREEQEPLNEEPV